MFSDGITKSFDCVNLINKYPQCSLLYNREFFLKGKNDVFAIIWNDDIDIDVEWIYEEGVEVENTDEYRLEALLGFKIKELRLSKEMSQKELSKLTGIDQGNISKIEHGDMHYSLSLIDKISKALNNDIKFSFFKR